MAFLSEYPPILIIQMVLVLLSVLCHMFNMFLVLYTGSLKIFAIR